MRDAPILTSQNVIGYLDHWAETSPESAALVFPERLHRNGTLEYRTLSFAELSRRVDRLSAALAARGLARGDRFVVMIPMSLELYILLLALLKRALVIVFIDPWVGLTQIKRCIALTEPKAFAGTPAIQLLGRLSGVLAPIPMRLTARGPAMPREWQLERLMDEEHPPVPTEDVRPETTALVTFTTGSTGLPKGANRTHGFLLAQHRALSREMGLRAGEADLTTLPIFVLNNLAAGVTSVLPRMKASKPADVDPAVIVRQIRDHGITTAVGSPAFWKPVAEHCAAQGLSLDTLRTLFTGGGPVPPGLLETLSPLMPNGQAKIGYGSTEAEPVALISAAEVIAETGAMTRAGQGNCVGQPAEGISLRVIPIVEGPVMAEAGGVDAMALPVGAVGELVVTGEHVGKDYYRNPQAVRENKIVDPDGKIWHRLGDVGYLDEAGRIWLVGRVNNLVSRGEKTLYPLPVEAIAQQQACVRQAALVEHEGRAVLVVRPVTWSPARRRREWAIAIAEALARHDMAVDAIRFLRQLPVDPRHNVKIDTAKLKRRLRRRA